MCCVSGLGSKEGISSCRIPFLSSLALVCCARSRPSIIDTNLCCSQATHDAKPSLVVFLVSSPPPESALRHPFDVDFEPGSLRGLHDAV